MHRKICRFAGAVQPQAMVSGVLLRRVGTMGGGAFQIRASVTQRRELSMQQLFKQSFNIFDPYYIKLYLAAGFLFSMLYLSVFLARDTIAKGAEQKKEETQAERTRRQKNRDPRRPPWPALHQRVVNMREGKLGHEDISLLWEQTKYYYPEDWLIPIELAQILKYSSAVYLSAYVDDPDRLRKEVISQLLDVKNGRVNNADRVNGDVMEIISIAVDELENFKLDSSVSAPLVPTMTKRSAAAH